ncbi:MAG: DMT family transporter [Candidatus Nitricoxidivorans perseverans]|uniref:DMT family transporter n=1 Tax=Candidatus Nitricoxidivorans perseverans TaxID=2975601 RepID=A0AA49FLT0_9PROT|nr:MAG: DMT family transporter [Candidatus Nitricoxidivorans perseverans]
MNSAPQPTPGSYSSRLFLLVALAMTAFAANSLLCRLALRGTGIDAASFTGVRIASGAITLLLIVWWQQRNAPRPPAGSWRSALALFAYAAGFSYAYLQLSAAVGALLLFGAVQLTMIGYGIWSGERLRIAQILGLLLAIAGLIGLLLPGLTAPPPFSAALMIVAGAAWGVYSLRGRGTTSAIEATAGNFLRAVPLALALVIIAPIPLAADWPGITSAIASGALASGVGYAIWYTALPGLTATHAATVQLSVPVLTALGGVLFLGETITPRLTLGSLAILGGIALVIGTRRKG